MANLTAALVMAFLALPAVGMGAWFARDPRPTSPVMALHMALVGIVMLLAALALYLVGDDRTQAMWITIALAVAVNALMLSLVLRIRRVREDRTRPQ